MSICPNCSWRPGIVYLDGTRWASLLGPFPEVLCWNLLPKLISIGSFYLPTYGVLVALGFLAGLTVAVRLGRRLGLPAETLTNLAVYVALAGLAGAKILMISF